MEQLKRYRVSLGKWVKVEAHNPSEAEDIAINKQSDDDMFIIMGETIEE